MDPSIPGTRGGRGTKGDTPFDPELDQIMIKKTTKKPQQEVPVSPQISPRNPINGLKPEVQVNASDQIITSIVLPILDIDYDVLVIHHNTVVDNNRKIVAFFKI